MGSSFAIGRGGARLLPEETEKAVAGILKLRPAPPPVLYGLKTGCGGGSGITKSGISSGPSCGRFGLAGLTVPPDADDMAALVIDVEAPAEILAKGIIGSTVFVVNAFPYKLVAGMMVDDAVE